MLMNITAVLGIMSYIIVLVYIVIVLCKRSKGQLCNNELTDEDSVNSKLKEVIRRGRMTSAEYQLFMKHYGSDPKKWIVK